MCVQHTSGCINRTWVEDQTSLIEDSCNIWVEDLREVFALCSSSLRFILVEPVRKFKNRSAECIVSWADVRQTVVAMPSLYTVECAEEVERVVDIRRCW